jgi:hypothetical protein
MTPSAKYAVLGAGAVSAIVLGLWPFLDAPARSGVLSAAAVALPVQVIAFAVIQRFRGEVTGFLVAWVGGTLVRMAVLGVVAVTLVRSASEGAVPMLLALAGFFFGLLLLEPVCFRTGPGNTVEA